MWKRKSKSPLRVLVMSTYVPRECGIATYAEDVIHAVEPHGAACSVLAMERAGEPYAYDDRVVGTVLEDRVESYLQAAEAVNAGGFDVLSLQHEYGLVVPERDPQALAEAALLLFDDSNLRGRIEGLNRTYGQTLLWPLVGAEYLRVFRQAAGRK